MLGDEVMGFGQYRDMTVADVRREHPSYICWANYEKSKRPTCPRLRRFLSIVREMDEAEAREEGARTINPDRKRARVEDGKPRRLDFSDDGCEQSGGKEESAASAPTCDESGAPAPSAGTDKEVKNLKEASPEEVKATAAADAALDSPKEYRIGVTLAVACAAYTCCNLTIYAKYDGSARDHVPMAMQ